MSDDFGIKSKIIILIVILLTITIGITYAYFSLNITGNETTETVNIGGARLSLKYAGTKTIIATNIIPGWSSKKYFNVTVNNDAEVDVSYNINLVITKSNFNTSSASGSSYLTYGLYSCTSSSDTTCSSTLLSQTTLTKQSGTQAIKTISSNQSETRYYALKLEFPNQNVAQNQTGTDGNVLTFSGYVTIDSSSTATITNFSSHSLARIASNVRNGATSLYNVGDTRKISIDGTNYTLRIVNNSTPSECSNKGFSQTACGFVVEFVDIIEQRTMGAYGNAWDETDVRKYLNGDFFNKLPTEIQDLIIYTNAVSNNAGNGTTSTTDKVYLLSPAEIFDGLTGNDADKTRQLDYYKKLGVTTANYEKAIKKYNAINSPWWLRSYYRNSYTLLSNPILAAIIPSTSTFYYVTSDGNYDYAVDEVNTYGISPAFRIG